MRYCNAIRGPIEKRTTQNQWGYQILTLYYKIW